MCVCVHTPVNPISAMGRCHWDSYIQMEGIQRDSMIFKDEGIKK